MFQCFAVTSLDVSRYDTNSTDFDWVATCYGLFCRRHFSLNVHLCVRRIGMWDLRRGERVRGEGEKVSKYPVIRSIC